MNLSAPHFQTLFYFSSEHISIVEIKRLDLHPTATKSDRFHWLLINQDQTIQKLTFVSMGEGNDFQTREFKEGKLRFNKTQGFYDAEMSHPLKCLSPNDLPDALASLLRDYLT